MIPLATTGRSERLRFSGARVLWRLWFWFVGSTVHVGSWVVRGFGGSRRAAGLLINRVVAADERFGQDYEISDLFRLEISSDLPVVEDGSLFPSATHCDPAKILGEVTGT